VHISFVTLPLFSILLFSSFCALAGRDSATIAIIEKWFLSSRPFRTLSGFKEAGQEMQFGRKIKDSVTLRET